ncbi:ATP-grasp domain-containing protein [Actinorugispora endophytica]|uniref:ATP-grasp domain-containing protein n=1 Tax=Actinorugispora endophytica TaxID=1605990 RepID=UPI00105F7E1A|nr:ATP-grasp domain-containing protein [Actinorugispora endophytica]
MGQDSVQPTVVVTTAGSPSTPETILRLRRQGYRVIATDIEANAPGLYLADRSHLVPPGDSDAFVADLRDICAREGASAVIPLVDEELAGVSLLEREGITVLLPRLPFITTCLDKYVLMRRLAAAGIGVPSTRLASEPADGLAFPLIVKPRSGRGSRGVSVCFSRLALDRLLATTSYPVSDLIVQERIRGPEFTVSVVVWRDGEVQAVVPKEVILKQGVTRFAVTRRNEEVERTCRAVQSALRADGPFNVQLCLDEAGTPRVFEINPRFSSTASLTTAAGVDEIGGLLGQALGRGPRLVDEWREGLVMVRHWTDEFTSEKEFDAHDMRPGPGALPALGSAVPVAG